MRDMRVEVGGKGRGGGKRKEEGRGEELAPYEVAKSLRVSLAF